MTPSHLVFMIAMQIYTIYRALIRNGKVFGAGGGPHRNSGLNQQNQRNPGFTRR